MKKAIFPILFLLYSMNCLSQNAADSVKKRWNIGPLPALAFDSVIRWKGAVETAPVLN